MNTQKGSTVRKVTRALLAERRLTVSEWARLMQITPTWATAVVDGRKPPGAELQKRIDLFLQFCWVCGKKW